jgi:hypothetical protein
MMGGGVKIHGFDPLKTLGLSSLKERRRMRGSARKTMPELLAPANRNSGRDLQMAQTMRKMFRENGNQI